METGKNIDKNEKASGFIDLSKVSQEQLWKRRQIEWKTAFALWTAIAVSSGFIYRYAHRPLPEPEKWIFLLCFFLIFSLITWLHKRHLKAIFISNERDLDFINYYRDRAAWEIEPESFTEKPKRPKWADQTVEGWSSKESETEYFEGKKDKMRHHYNPVLVTFLIAIVSLVLLSLMCFEIK